MGKIVVAEFVSLDGVIENPAWTVPFWNDDIADYKSAEMREADALLLGRVTHEAFAAAWPNHPEEGEYKDKMNAMPKHVASSRSDLEWNGHRIEGDLADSIAKLRAEQNLLVFGSSKLVHFLEANGLVDEYRLVVYPVLLGKGDRLWTDVDAEATLEAVETTALDNGVILSTYRVGAPTVTRPSFG
ncbi:dihydrofolate reductase family protein [Nocardia otitidiscaviarum]|uniref:dihydrofolate reductase family protein n=1 Tax=Nocardia otitidiscaviarum TaxID=1823 RepID=UPI0004A6CEF9|nr:dihydrofolate reductase family protein [Nocardia otitidiscaviarum]MBF6135725.1 dihydrofolate reductase family protein [Nocardia otitidiscaviarum]MBF6178637.1 dihydrofolate reductase family protein [Nocardia otitidiscaviarum]MBF6237826.1 dihydrofolate reductase family protein [Nocardia otitidiscaviarum]MBF6483538.1 dihydrofolate reductase family protein [Nocardia otitidiscaviarum]